MKKKALLLFLGIFSLSFGAGYKIPEQSVRSTGSVASYMSAAEHADSVYFNPANMSWLRGNWFFEGGVRYIYLPSIGFEGYVLDPVRKQYVYLKTESRSEEFLVPYFHVVSPPIGNFRFGLSFVTPGGLSKKWDAVPASAYAKEFTLKVYETDFAVSYRVNRYLSLGGGLRGVYADGTVEFYYPQAYRIKMEGDTDVRWGYYVSISLRPTKSLNLSALYRSKVNLKIKGSANGFMTVPVNGTPTLYPVNTSGSVMVPLPAELRVSASYKLQKTTLEFTLERTFWSKYEYLNFNYEDPIVEGTFGKPKEKDWDDVNTYRFGLYHQFSPKFRGMLGLAYSESPIPSRTLGFELPEPKYTWILSLGGIYRPRPSLELGLAYLYLVEGSRRVDNQTIKGEFTDISAHLLTLSLGLRF